MGLEICFLYLIENLSAAEIDGATTEGPVLCPTVYLLYPAWC